MDSLPKDIKYYLIFFLDWYDYSNMCEILKLSFNFKFYFKKCRQRIKIDDICMYNNKKGPKEILMFMTRNKRHKHKFSQSNITWLYDNENLDIIKRIDIKYSQYVIINLAYDNNIKEIEYFLLNYNIDDQIIINIIINVLNIINALLPTTSKCKIINNVNILKCIYSNYNLNEFNKKNIFCHALQLKNKDIIELVTRFHNTY